METRKTPGESTPTASVAATRPAVPATASPAPAPVNHNYYYPAPAPRRQANPAWPWVLALVFAIAIIGLVATYLYWSGNKNCGVATPCPAVAPCPTAAPCPVCPTCPAQRQRRVSRKPAPVTAPAPKPTPKPPCETCQPQSGQTGGFTEDPPVTRPTNKTFTEDAPVTRPADNRPRRTSQDRSENRSSSSEEIEATIRQREQDAYMAGQANQSQGPSTKAVLVDALLQTGGRLANAAIYRSGNGQYGNQSYTADQRYIPDGQGGSVDKRNPLGYMLGSNCAFIGGCR